MCISDILKRKLALTDRFVYGSIMPDMLKQKTGDRDGTHYIENKVVDGEIRYLPNIQRAIQELDIKDEQIRLGYIAHLIQDYIWYNDFIPQYVKCLGNNKVQYANGDIALEQDFRKEIYKEYSNISEYMVNKCNVDLDTLVESLKYMIHDEKQINYVMENVTYSQNLNIEQNKFITKKVLDSYIRKTVKQVEIAISRLMGE